MSNTKITLAEVIEAASSNGEWVNDEFEAIVIDAKPPVGRKPSKAVLVDPDNDRIELAVNNFAGDLTRYEGKRCLFHGQGMKVKDYRGKAELNLSDKSLINVIGAAEGAGKRDNEPNKDADKDADKNKKTGATPAERANKFHLTMKKVALLWLHAEQYAEEVWRRVPHDSVIKQSEGGYQSLISTLFISARDEGLMNAGVPLRDRTTDGVLIPFKPVVDDEARKAAEALERQREAERREREEREAAERAQQDQDVPF